MTKPETHSHSGRILDSVPQSLIADAMAQAVFAARSAARPFGAALIDVRSESIPYCNANTTQDQADRFAHAEMNVLRAGLAANADLAGHVLVSTAEPCPMCASASVFARVGAIVYGTSIAVLSDLGWDQIHLSAATVVAAGPSPIEVRGGFDRDETDSMYRHFTNGEG